MSQKFKDQWLVTPIKSPIDNWITLPKTNSSPYRPFAPKEKDSKHPFSGAKLVVRIQGGNPGIPYKWVYNRYIPTFEWENIYLIIGGILIGESHPVIRSPNLDPPFAVPFNGQGLREPKKGSFLVV